MQFARAFASRTLLDAIARLRKKPIEAYAIAVTAVALATLLRFPLMEPLTGAGPFTLYQSPSTN